MERFKSYDLYCIGEAKSVVEFPVTNKEYVAATVGNSDYVYYKRYEGDKFYKLDATELSFMKLKGEEIPF